MGIAPDAAAGQLLAVNVTVNMEVDDVGVGVDEVVAVAARHEGQVYGSDISLAAGNAAFANIVIKLPPDKIASAIVEIKLLGTHLSQTQATENVTDQMVDIETRIGTAQRSVERVQLLLAEAENLGQVVQLEAELTSRQTVLEQLLAHPRRVADRDRLYGAVPRRHRACRSGVVRQSSPSGATKSISCSTAPTSSGRRSAND